VVIFPLHELAGLPPAERAARGLLLLDTRFTPECLEGHPNDRGLADMIVAREDGEKSAEQRRGEVAQLAARADHDVCDRLDRITCPTLIACGNYDGIAPKPNSEAIGKRIDHADLRFYEGGHAFFAQDPKALPEILDFLAVE
jgi:pimeloyl-ACP methyl ester carboxylesterase